MKLSRKQLAEKLLSFVEQGGDSKKIAAYLIETKQTSSLDGVIREMMRLREEKDGVAEINATSAHALTQEIKDTVSKAFDARRAIFNEKIDKQSNVAGARFTSLDRQLDLTAASKLNRLKSLGA